MQPARCWPTQNFGISLRRTWQLGAEEQPRKGVHATVGGPDSYPYRLTQPDWPVTVAPGDPSPRALACPPMQLVLAGNPEDALPRTEFAHAEDEKLTSSKDENWSAFRSHAIPALRPDTRGRRSGRPRHAAAFRSACRAGCADARLPICADGPRRSTHRHGAACPLPRRPNSLAKVARRHLRDAFVGRLRPPSVGEVLERKRLGDVSVKIRHDLSNAECSGPRPHSLTTGMALDLGSGACGGCRMARGVSRGRLRGA